MIMFAMSDAIALLGVTATNTVSALMGLKADGKAWPNVGDEGEFKGLNDATPVGDSICHAFVS